MKVKELLDFLSDKDPELNVVSSYTGYNDSQEDLDISEIDLVLSDAFITSHKIRLHGTLQPKYRVEIYLSFNEKE